MKLCTGIHLIGSGFDGMFLTDRLDCNVYVFDTGEGWVLVDAGLGREPEKILEVLRNDGIHPEQLKYLILTHAHGDHIGGAAYFRRLGVTVIAPDIEAGIVERAIEHEMGIDVAKAIGYYSPELRIEPCKIDKVVAIGEKFILGNIEITCLSAKGHSPAGLCYHMRYDGKNILFTGDIIRHGGITILQDIPGSSMENYIESICGLKNIDVDISLPGHGMISMQNGREHIELAIKELNL